MLDRRGNVLVVVLALTLLLAAQIVIVNTFSVGGFRHLNKVNAHVRAIYIGESAFARMLARIKGAPWEARWFAAAPKADASVPLLGGSYSSFVSTVASPEKQADVWIQARFEGAVAVMFWRVRYVDDTLDFFAQVYPTFFTFLPPDSTAPTGGPNPTTTMIVDMIDKQRTNGRPALDKLDRIRGARDFPTIARELDVPLRGVPLDTLSPPGAAPLPQDQYLGDIDRDLGGLPPVPAEPAPPSPPAPPEPDPPVGGISGPPGPGPQTALGRQYPSPTNMTDVIRAILGQTASTPPMDPDLPTSTHFADPEEARRQWQLACAQFIFSWENDAIAKSIDHTTSFVSQMVARNTPADPRPECTAAADALIGYFADITTARSQKLNRPPPPDPASVNPSPGDAAGYARALTAYKDWWLANH
jgi:hypothetical protein